MTSVYANWRIIQSNLRLLSNQNKTNQTNVLLISESRVDGGVSTRVNDLYSKWLPMMLKFNFCTNLDANFNKTKAFDCISLNYGVCRFYKDSYGRQSDARSARVLPCRWNIVHHWASPDLLISYARQRRINGWYCVI